MTKASILKLGRQKGYIVNPKLFKALDFFSNKEITEDSIENLKIQLDLLPNIVNCSINSGQAIKQLKQIKPMLDVFNPGKRNERFYKKHFLFKHQKDKFHKAIKFGCNKIEAYTYAI